ncbi:helix-turn-helix domain-containing protein [Vibrio sp.]|nr:helix-turn-helix domain-containing protein [Vibrio sp.]
MVATNIISTQNLDSKQIVGYWNDAVSKIYAPCHNILLKSNFYATAQVTEFGLSELSHIDSGGVDYSRTSHNIRQDQKDDIFISVMLRGVGYFTQFGKQVTQKEGDILIHDSAYPYLYQYPDQYRSIFYKIPRGVLESRIPNLDKLGGSIIPRDSAYANSIASFLNSAYIMGSDSNVMISNDISEPITALLTGCLQKALLGSRDDINMTRQKIILENIKEFMLNHLQDDTLDLKSIAEQQHISIRTLNRLFAEIGETPMHWLQTKRLNCAYQMILSQRSSSITDIALRNGFNDLSHFGRLFKRQFGQSPTQIRTRKQ